MVKGNEKDAEEEEKGIVGNSGAASFGSPSERGLGMRSTSPCYLLASLQGCSNEEATDKKLLPVDTSQVYQRKPGNVVELVVHFERDRTNSRKAEVVGRMMGARGLYFLFRCESFL